MIVLDASACIEWALNTDLGRQAAARLERESTLHAPHLIDLEVAQVLRRYVRRAEITSERGHEALQSFVALDLERYDHTALLPRIWELRDNLTAYDAAYVALAEALDMPLVTTDERLAAASGHHAVVQLLRV